VKRYAFGHLRFAVLAALCTLHPCSPLIVSARSEATDTPRLRVSEDLSDPRTVRNCLSAACEAANTENLDGFLECFTSTAKRKLRKPAAVLFVQHEVSMELLDSQIIEQSEARSEAAVKYRTKRSDDTYTVVSLVDLKKENGYWKISKERIQTVEHQSPSMCSPSRYACFGGQCQVR
jgi:hypothetical protein